VSIAARSGSPLGWPGEERSERGAEQSNLGALAALGSLPPVRTLWTVLAAGSALAAASCTTTGGGLPGGADPEPTRVLTSAVPPTHPSAPASSTPAPPAPSPAAVPVRAVPACARASCQVTAVVGNARPGIHLALVRGPDHDLTRQTGYLLSLNSAAAPLQARQLRSGDVFFDASLGVATCDRLRHCFVAAGVGAHGSVLNVVAVGPAGELTDLSQGGELATNTSELRAHDLDGDGVAEVLAVVNDYQPDYADGTRYWMVWSWRGGRYVSLGCRKVQRGEREPGGPLAPSGCPS
jgi:hypothetical protein